MSKKRAPREIHFAGYTFDIAPSGDTSVRKGPAINVTAPGDYGSDPVDIGRFRMIPSGDIVDGTERDRRLNARAAALRPSGVETPEEYGYRLGHEAGRIAWGYVKCPAPLEMPEAKGDDPYARGFRDGCRSCGGGAPLEAPDVAAEDAAYEAGRRIATDDDDEFGPRPGEAPKP